MSIKMSDYKHDTRFVYIVNYKRLIMKQLIERIGAFFSDMSLTKRIIISAVFVIIVFIFVAHFALAVMQNFPNSADEYAYVFQARNLARFQLYAPVHENSPDGFRMQSYFYFVHVGENEGKYYGRFPFGYSLLMVPAAWIEALFGVDMFWTTNTLFAALTLLLLFLIVKRYFDTATAIIAVIIGGLNPWFLFTSGSYFSQITCAFFIGLFIYTFLLAIDEADEKKSRIKFIITGLCFGFAILVRFLDPLAYIIPSIILYLVLTARHGRLTFKKMLKDIGWFAAGAGFFMLCLLLYNKGLTGKFFLTAYQYFNPHDSGTRFIFVVHKDGVDTYDFTKIWEVGYLQRTVPNVKLMFEWFKWGYALALLPLALIMRRKDTKQLIIILALFIMPLLVILVYMLYGGPPMNQYGPRYYFSYFVPITILAAFSISNIARGKFRLLAIPIVIVFAVMSLNSTMQKKKHVHDEIFDRRNLFRTIEHYDIHNSVVFLLSFSGSMYNGDLTRNSLDFDNDVILSQTLGGHYGPMIRYYPDREFYEYRYQGRNKIGSLTKLITKPNGSYFRDLPKVDLSKIKIGGNGIMAMYYKGHNFDTLVHSQQESVINFDWKKDRPIEQLDIDHFSVRFDAVLKIDREEEYTFYTNSDDGVRLFVDNNLLIDNWTPHPATENREAIYLAEGYHTIRLEYFEDSYDSIIQLFYSSPTIVKTIIPAEKYYMMESK